ncbi:MAG: hypothetical protein WCQ54_06545 [Clostridiaceae bacterium]
MDILIKDQIKLKFMKGPICPHCGSKDINKFGFFNEKQRYRCKDCKKTFNLYTKTLLSWSHYKDKWDSFVHTMREDVSLRKAEKEVGVSYAALFYWRHKIMTILNEENDTELHGTLELISMKLKYLDKNRKRKNEEDDDELEKLGFGDAFEEEKASPGGAQNIFFAFLYQRDDRLESYIYKEKTGARSFIYDLSDSIDKKSIVCLSSNYPFRYPLLYKKIKVADKKSYKRVNYFNADSARKYLGQFKCWIKMFRGVSSKNLPKYAAFFKAHKIFNNMECIILSSLRQYENLRNQYAIRGALGF